MNKTQLMLPQREQKPRSHGITALIDNGIPLSSFIDTISSASRLIDYVKFGWGTSLITNKLEEKIECLQEHDVHFFFGGTLFEKFLSQGRIDDYHEYCRQYGCKYVEISNGTLALTNKDKARYIRDFSKEFTVFSEVGNKDSNHHKNEDISQWVDWIQEDFEAGAHKVITEARESGTSGVCNSNGELRLDLIDCILTSGMDLESIIFEAPNKKMQTTFIKKVGPNVNLANIPFSDTISVETLRLGLRSDTFDLL
ncbi:phosphosulfolactate synthase [Robertmurraya korlensis]|uniref:phosphosulfolactate synthase n=1 Tax=Robertmurraya korlensis TaxID=519977 RepID=UPI000824D863|nr:phosphosulfolactate synthase [Robertmurraya korlensis]